MEKGHPKGSKLRTDEKEISFEKSVGKGTANEHQSKAVLLTCVCLYASSAEHSASSEDAGLERGKSRGRCTEERDSSRLQQPKLRRHVLCSACRLES